MPQKHDIGYQKRIKNAEENERRKILATLHRTGKAAGRDYK